MRSARGKLIFKGRASNSPYRKGVPQSPPSCGSHFWLFLTAAALTLLRQNSLPHGSMRLNRTSLPAGPDVTGRQAPFGARRPPLTEIHRLDGTFLGL